MPVMSGMRGLTLVMVLVVCLLEVSEGVQLEDLALPQEAADENEVKLPPELSKQSERFFGVASTRTYTNVVMVTSTLFFSCLSGTKATTVCKGRRKKSVERVLEVLPEEEKRDLESSIDGATETPDEDKSTKSQDDTSASTNQKFFTIWTTTQTTTSVTMFYTNTSTTIRLSYYCNAGQEIFPTFKCGGGK
nr:uncharacterized protein LOC128690031 isoform X1 [Cherax quadricarinatus]XP_053634522.1 uncharacterized protein LOC128690031 isoform X2 [Cherax quadricarinatus]